MMDKNNTLKDNLVTLILGGSRDGEIKSSDKKFYLHIQAIKSLYFTLLSENFNLGNINMRDDNEACFDIINNGHIIIKTLDLGEKFAFMVYVPLNMSIAQLKSLKSIAKQMENNDIYFCQIDGECINCEVVDGIEKKLNFKS